MSIYSSSNVKNNVGIPQILQEPSMPFFLSHRGSHELRLLLRVRTLLMPRPGCALSEEEDVMEHGSHV